MQSPTRATTRVAPTGAQKDWAHDYAKVSVKRGLGIWRRAWPKRVPARGRGRETELLKGPRVKRGLRVNRSVRYWSGCRGDPCGRPLCRSYRVSNAIANAGNHKGRPYRSSEGLGTGLCKGLREAGTGDWGVEAAPAIRGFARWLGRRRCRRSLRAGFATRRTRRSRLRAACSSRRRTSSRPRPVLHRGTTA